MPRPPAAKKTDKTKAFIVADGFIIGDNDGKRKEGGDTIMLTHKQALHFQKQKAIIVPVEEFGNEFETDNSEGRSGTEIEGPGEPDSGRVSDSDDDASKGTTSSRRKRSSL